MLKAPHIKLLKQLTEINTVTPMESGERSSLPEANALYANAAVAIGMEILSQGSGQLNGTVPVSVLRRQQAMGDEFLNNQPSLVVGLGDWQNRERTVMFNFHMDTVGPHLPVQFTNDIFYGRGVADNKGPGVAVLAAIEAWLEQRTSIGEMPGVLVQCVGGEEGGAMGVYGSRWLMEQGYYGGLNVFVIPSEMNYFDESTTSMTVELRVDGLGSSDDSPWAGDNATLILATMVQFIAQYLAEPLENANVKMTVAGMYTGDMHNRVYGQGCALFNFSYRSSEAAKQTEALFEQALVEAKKKFVADFSAYSLFKRSVYNLEVTLKNTWLKKGLPVLKNRNDYWENLLTQANIMRHAKNESTFTCDAMWGQRPGCHTIMFGPGSLTLNGVHTDREHLSLLELNKFTQAIFRLLTVISES